MAINIRPSLLGNVYAKLAPKFEGRAQTSSGPSRPQVVAWITVVCLALILSVRDFQAYQVGAHFDDARYVILARSLLQSDRFGMIELPGNPGPTPFPFGYPLLLAPLVFLFPNNLDILKVPSLIATLLNASLLFWGWRWFGRGWGHWWGVGVAGLYALSPLAVDLSRRIMSEPIFTSFCLLSILLAEQSAQGQKKWWWTPAMSVLLFFAVFTRTIGVVLPFTVFTYLVFVRRIAILKELGLVVVHMAALLALVVLLTPVAAPDLLPQQYVDYTRGGDLEQVRTILVSYYDYRIIQHLGRDIRSAVLPVGGGTAEQTFASALGMPTLPIIFGLSLSCVIALGYGYWFAKRRLSTFQLFSVLYFGILWLWAWEDPRLLYPIQPQLIFGLILGIQLILLASARFLGRTQSWSTVSGRIVTIVVFALLSLSVYGSARIENSQMHIGDLQARSSWLKANTAPAAVIMSEAHEIDALYSMRKAVGFPSSLASTDDLEQYFSNYHVDYVLVAPKVAWEPVMYIPSYSPATSSLLPLISHLAAEKRVTLVYSSETALISVYKVN